MAVYLFQHFATYIGDLSTRVTFVFVNQFYLFTVFWTRLTNSYSSSSRDMPRGMMSEVAVTGHSSPPGGGG